MHLTEKQVWWGKNVLKVVKDFLLKEFILGKEQQCFLASWLKKKNEHLQNVVILIKNKKKFPESILNTLTKIVFFDITFA